MISSITIKKKENAFFDSLDVSNNTKRVYKQSLNSSFLKNFLKDEYGYESIFETDDIKILTAIYCSLNVHPKNILNHRGYSASVMKYIRFLNKGVKPVKRTDFGVKKK